MTLLKDWPFTEQTLKALQDLRNDGEEFRLVETCSVYRGGPRKLKPEQIAVPLDIDRNHIYVRSAAMKWRSAA